MELQGAHVLITGASRGIGAAMASSFAAAGARVSIAARSTAALEEVARPIDAAPFTVDLADADQTERLIATVEAEAGPIDVLMNNAGIETTEHFHTVDSDALRQVARVNLEAPMVLTRQVLPQMLDRNRGHLGFTSSLAGTSGFPGLTPYGATKAGLTNFVAGLRLELRDTDIHTTVITPGPVDTAMWDQLEQSAEIDPVIRRMRRLQLIPMKTPAYLAERTVEAVRSDARHVRTPRRLSTSFWLREAPARITELLMTGVDVGPKRG
ncbi:MAG: SDR family NAD(P)-dependent oxidoreductase [Acidimicrobiales bacterium]